MGTGEASESGLPPPDGPTLVVEVEVLVVDEVVVLVVLVIVMVVEVVEVEVTVVEVDEVEVVDAPPFTLTDILPNAECGKPVRVET